MQGIVIIKEATHLMHKIKNVIKKQLKRNRRQVPSSNSTPKFVIMFQATIIPLFTLISSMCFGMYYHRDFTTGILSNG